MPSRGRTPGLIVDASTSDRMAKIRQRGTKPELVVRAVARQMGLRYRVSNRDLPGSPDVANRRRKWAVFVHGCYWHRHEGCVKATTPTRNRDFWLAKFAANGERDRRAVESLWKLGYEVVVVWECETRTLERVEALLRPIADGRRSELIRRLAAGYEGR